MSIPRQQPHAIAKFKHQARTTVPKPVVIPAHMVPYDGWSPFAWDGWDSPGNTKRTASEMKRFKARASRKSRK